MALSYTWGPAYVRSSEEQAAMNSPLSILCDGFEVPVTENLFDALSQLRQISDIKLIWIDAICINQESLEERSLQVLLMGSIYSKAQHVIIWLGKQILHFGGFLWVITTLLPKLENMAKKTGWDEIYASTPGDPVFDTKLGLDGSEMRKNLLAYGDFHDANRWFVRAWIVQVNCFTFYLTLRGFSDTFQWNGEQQCRFTSLGLVI